MSRMATFTPDVSKWAAWTPGEVAEILAGVDAPWYVAGGWAIDLFLGGQRREHADLEIAVPKDRFHEIAAALTDYELYAVRDGRATALSEDPDALDTTHQTWVRDAATDRWRLDVFRDPSDGDEWIFRRDPRISRLYATVVSWTSSRIPYGCPEVILLFKASRADEEKHRDDFAAVLPRLDSGRRSWLADALRLVHPGHPWLDHLDAGD